MKMGNNEVPPKDFTISPSICHIWGSNCRPKALLARAEILETALLFTVFLKAHEVPITVLFLHIMPVTSSCILIRYITYHSSFSILSNRFDIVGLLYIYYINLFTG